jgi:hypothetical protein
MTDPDPREVKLPVWARNLLNQERISRRAAERKLAEHLETVEPSPIWYGDHNNPIYVPVNYGYQTVYFSTTGKPSKHTYEEIGVSFRQGTIQVQGGTSVTINPTASNCFDINLRER